MMIKEHSVTPEQILLVQASFADILPIADSAAVLFYGRLFELDPSLRPLFRGEMPEQGHKLMTMIRAVVNGLHRLDQLIPIVQNLGRRHAAYGVTGEHYDIVAEALLWTLRQGLGARWTPNVEAAWMAAYTLLADTMKTAAEPRAAVA
jgi:hemoglobin-like flavoprotein